MSTSTLLSFEVSTYASKTDRRKLTVLAKDEAAARSAAIAGHRAAIAAEAKTPRLAELARSASVLTTGCRVIDPLLALERAGRPGDDAA